MPVRPHTDRRPGIVLRAGLLLLLLAAAGCSADEGGPSVRSDTSFRIDGVVDFYRADSTFITRIAVEIAEGDSARARGLMQRRHLSQRAGMLFIDERADTQTFWMENTPIPLDMIFVDEQGRVLNVEGARPFSRETVRSVGPARYNVEVRAGFGARHGIGPGSFIRWRRVETSTEL